MDLGAIHKDIQCELDAAYRRVLDDSGLLAEKQMKSLNGNLRLTAVPRRVSVPVTGWTLSV